MSIIAMTPRRNWPAEEDDESAPQDARFLRAAERAGCIWDEAAFDGTLTRLVTPASGTARAASRRRPADTA